MEVAALLGSSRAPERCPCALTIAFDFEEQFVTGARQFQKVFLEYARRIRGKSCQAAILLHVVIRQEIRELEGDALLVLRYHDGKVQAHSKVNCVFLAFKALQRDSGTRAIFDCSDDIV